MTLSTTQVRRAIVPYKLHKAQCHCKLFFEKIQINRKDLSTASGLVSLVIRKRIGCLRSPSFHCLSSGVDANTQFIN